MTQPDQFPPGVDQDAMMYMKVFHPYATMRAAEAYQQNLRFAHYTSSAVGLEILRNRQTWMRQVSCMTDYMEVDHGLNCIDTTLFSERGTRLSKFLNSLFPGIFDEIVQRYDASKHLLRSETFITCLSEHAGQGFEDEDQYGRLSMWRAYGRTTGIAFVINQSMLWNVSANLGIFTSPVAYLTDIQFAEQADILASTLEANADFLKAIGREQVRNSLVNAFTTAAVSTKHPGFKEEREWRIVRMPTFPIHCPLERQTKVINGVPQEVLFLDLSGTPPLSVPGFEIPSILERVIIGPTELAYSQHRAFAKALEEVGVPDPAARVKASNIPLRDAPR